MIREATPGNNLYIFFSELCSFSNGMCLTAKVIFDSDV